MSGGRPNYRSQRIGTENVGFSQRHFLEVTYDLSVAQGLAQEGGDHTDDLVGEIKGLSFAVASDLGLAVGEKSGLLKAYLDRIDDLFANAVDAGAREITFKFEYTDTLDSDFNLEKMKENCSEIALVDDGGGFPEDMVSSEFAEYDKAKRDASAAPKKGDDKVGGRGKALVFLKTGGAKVLFRNRKNADGEVIGSEIKLEWLGKPTLSRRRESGSSVTIAPEGFEEVLSLSLDGAEPCTGGALSLSLGGGSAGAGVPSLWQRRAAANAAKEAGATSPDVSPESQKTASVFAKGRFGGLTLGDVESGSDASSDSDPGSP